jgi:hypothetical protein
MQAKSDRKNAAGVGVEEPASDELRPLLENRMVARVTPVTSPGGVIVGELVAIVDEGRTPLIVAPGVPAVKARATVDVHGTHIGSPVVLVFENGDPALPIILGVLRNDHQPLDAPSSNLDVEADGERLVVSARQQLVLRCGKASITLTRAGKVLVQGTYISSRSSGVNRIRGGSVHLN